MAKWNALLRFHYRVDPDTLPDDEWAKLVQEYRYLNDRQNQEFQTNLKVVLYELASAIYGKNQ
jgi:hypothetical protein